MDRAFRGIWIPAEIWLNKDLSTNEKVLLAEIDSLSGEEGCYASNQYFADFFGLSKERARKVIASLKDKGYITVTLIYKENSNEVDKRILKLTGYGQKQPGGYNQPGGMVENDHYITKSNNINNNKKPKKKETRHKYGEYQHVLLSDAEYNNLVDSYGKDIVDKYIDKMDVWIEAKGKSPYKRYGVAIKNWLKNAGIEPNKKVAKKEGDIKHDEEYFMKLMEEQLKGNKLG